MHMVASIHNIDVKLNSRKKFFTDRCNFSFSPVHMADLSGSQGTVQPGSFI